jgi:hypothetical protein
MGKKYGVEGVYVYSHLALIGKIAIEKSPKLFYEKK